METKTEEQNYCFIALPNGDFYFSKLTSVNTEEASHFIYYPLTNEEITSYQNLLFPNGVITKAHFTSAQLEEEFGVCQITNKLRLSNSIMTLLEVIQSLKNTSLPPQTTKQLLSILGNVGLYQIVQSTILETDLIADLVSLLNATNEETQEAAIVFIANIVSIEERSYATHTDTSVNFHVYYNVQLASEIQNRILSSGGIEILLSLIQESNNVLQIKACGALSNLSLDNQAIQKVIYGKQFIPNLLVLSNSEKIELRQTAITLLGSLAFNRTHGDEIFDAVVEKGVLFYINLLNNNLNDEIIIKAILKILPFINANDIILAKQIPSITTLLTFPNNDILQNAIYVLINLAKTQNDEVLRIIGTHENIQTLISLLNASSLGVKSNAISALALLVSTPLFLINICTSQSIEALISLLAIDNSDVKVSALYILAHISCQPQFQHLFLEGNTISLLTLSLQNNSDERIQTCASTILLNSLGNKTILSRLLQHPADILPLVPTIIKLDRTARLQIFKLISQARGSISNVIEDRLAFHLWELASILRESRDLEFSLLDQTYLNLETSLKDFKQTAKTPNDCVALYQSWQKGIDTIKNELYTYECTENLIANCLFCLTIIGFLVLLARHAYYSTCSPTKSEHSFFMPFVKSCQIRDDIQETLDHYANQQGISTCG